MRPLTFPLPHQNTDMLTHGTGVMMQLATERDLRDAGAAERLSSLKVIPLL